MIMEGDSRCLCFLEAVLKSAAIHRLRNIGVSVELDIEQTLTAQQIHHDARAARKG